VAASIARAMGPLEREEGPLPFPITRALKDAMWTGCGVVRDRSGLLEAQARLDELTEQAQQTSVPGAAAANPSWQEALDLVNQLTVARVIVRSALARDESRGAHHRADHPQQDDERWLRFLAARRGPDGDAVLEPRPVAFTRRSPDGQLTEAVP